VGLFRLLFLKTKERSSERLKKRKKAEKFKVKGAIFKIESSVFFFRIFILNFAL